MDIVTERFRGLRRSFRRVDVGDDAQLGRVYDWWLEKRSTLVPGRPFHGIEADLADELGDLLVLDRLPSGEWRVGLYGEKIVAHTGFRMAGGNTSMLDPEVAAYFHEIYADFLERGEAGYSISPSNLIGSVQVWQRHIFPGPLTEQGGRCLALFRPLVTRADTMTHLGASGRVWTAYLEPMLDDDRTVKDFLLMDVIQPEPHGGLTWRPLTLSKLLKRKLSTVEIAELRTAPGGKRLFGDRVPVTVGNQEQELKLEVFSGVPRNMIVVTDVTAEYRAMRALVQAEKLAGITHWRWDSRTRMIEPSGALRTMFGISDASKQITVRAFAELLYRADGLKFVEWIAAAASGTPPAPIECRAVLKGAVRTFRLKADQRRDVDGTVISVFGVLQDVSDLKLIQSQLEERGAELNEAQRLGKLADWSQNLKERTIEWSPQLFDLVAYDPKRFRTTLANVASVYTASSLAALNRAQSHVIATGEIRSVDVQVRKGDGTMGDFMVTTKAERDTAGSIVGLFGTVQDITERKRSERQLEQLAYYDPLTGCANRALFGRELEEEFARSRDEPGQSAWSVFLIDLDNFKEVNDTLGHAAGDALLVRATERLRALIKPGDTLARLGGDEFAMILRNEASHATLLALAKTVVRDMAQPFVLPDGEAFVGASIGIVTLPQDALNGDEALRHADLALYKAKEKGRGRSCFFDATLNAEVHHRTSIAKRLRHAIDTNQLTLHFQPQVSLKDQSVIGMEALLRWPDPERGFIPPSEFIPIAESSTLILDVGVWTLNESCRMAREWLNASIPFGKVSVNTSASQIWQTNFVREVSDTIERHGVPAKHICIEFTESVFIDHSQNRVSQILAQLRELGVCLSLDDFGTGYSSLSYLNRLPFDELKVDRSFIAGAPGDRRRERMLSGIIALGSGLGMHVVAEGAETVEEIALLRDLDCPAVQGYAFGKPQPALIVPLEIERIRRMETLAAHDFQERQAAAS
jgi:diguanylate cyclase (GGDEF)-like protein